MKTSRPLYWIFLTITAAVTTGIAISTFLIKEWLAFAATLAVIAYLLTTYGSLKLNWWCENGKLRCILMGRFGIMANRNSNLVYRHSLNDERQDS